MCVLMRGSAFVYVCLCVCFNMIFFSFFLFLGVFDIIVSEIVLLCIRASLIFSMWVYVRLYILIFFPMIVYKRVSNALCVCVCPRMYIQACVFMRLFVRHVINMQPVFSGFSA